MILSLDVYVNIDDIPTTKKPKAHKGQQLVHTDDKESSLSPGALAGAGCAVLFLVVVVGFTIMNIYKRYVSISWLNLNYYASISILYLPSYILSVISFLYW